MSVYDKIYNKTATLADQEEACKNTWTAYKFALLKIPGTNIERCQEVACKNSRYAYYFAKDIPEANIKYCQEHSCKNSEYAYYFAKNIPGADIEYCRSILFKKFDKMIAEKVLK